MSQYPQYPQYPPQNPYMPPVTNYYAGSTATKRPASVTSVAIIGIIVGSMGVLCAGPGLVINAMMLGTGKNPFAPNLPAGDHTVIVISVFQTFVNLILSLMMLVCCIAALSLKPFARKVMIPTSVITLIWAVAVIIITVGWILPESERMSAAGHSTLNAANAQARQIGQVVGAILTGLFIAVVPACVLIFWTRLHVKAAFGDPEAMAKYASMQSPQGQYPPEQFPPAQYPPGQYPPTFPPQ